MDLKRKDYPKYLNSCIMEAVMKLEKKYRVQLILSIVFALIVSGSLFFMYSTFSFHTYDQVVYYDYMLSTSNDKISLENYEVYKDEKLSTLGGGTLVIKDSNILNVSDTLKITVKGKAENGKSVEGMYLVSSNGQTNSFSLPYNATQIKDKKEQREITSIKEASIKITNLQDAVILEEQLEVLPLQSVSGSNKEYRIENAYIGEKFMRLGKLAVNSDIQKEYPNISLEYRYVKDKKKEDYVVFKKVSETTKTYLEKKESEVFYLEDEEESLLDKELSVVVILSNSEDQYAFSIDLSKAGETNE